MSLVYPSDVYLIVGITLVYVVGVLVLAGPLLSAIMRAPEPQRATEHGEPARPNS